MAAIIIATLLAILFGCTAGVPNLDKYGSDGKIVGGFPVNISQVPWQVSLSYKKAHLCGGSIISNKWILTAAHCLHNRYLKSFEVRIGATDNLKGGALYKVEQIIIHKKFKGPSTFFDYDFGLLRLSEEVTFSDVAKAVELPKVNDEDIITGTTCLVSGWGDTRNFTESSRYLRAVEVPKIRRIICNIPYKWKVTSRMFCAGLYGQGGKDSCQGDSGGPVVVYDNKTKEPTLVGIVSWGYGCAEKKYPGVYSRVLAAREWIRENTGI